MANKILIGLIVALVMFGMTMKIARACGTTTADPVEIKFDIHP